MNLRDDITFCCAYCKTDCFRKPKYIVNKYIPHSFSDFSSHCMAYDPSYENIYTSENSKEGADDGSL